MDDTLCRKRGLTVYGTGMHHDPLISSRAKPLTSWGHDWVVVTLYYKAGKDRLASFTAASPPRPT